MATLNTDLVALCPELNADAVREIIDTSLTDARINAFLNMAWFISRPVSGLLGDCGGSAAECEIIKLLAAHLITIIERQVKSESIAGEWSVTYLGTEGLGLDASLYGQQAVVMDCSGALAEAGLKGASLKVFGYEDLQENLPDASWFD